MTVVVGARWSIVLLELSDWVRESWYNRPVLLVEQKVLNSYDKLVVLLGPPK